MKTLGNQQFDGWRISSARGYPNTGFRLLVCQGNQALFVNHQDGTGHRLDDRAKALLAGAQLRRQLRGHAIMSQPSS
jgi:hypothetical protein